MRSTTICAFALSAALALSACGGSGSGTTSPPATSPTSNTGATGSSTTATSTVATTSTSSSTQTSGPPACVAADLSVSYLGQNSATGHGELGFELGNRSSQSCHTYGYPGILFLGKNGQPLPTDSTRTTHDFFGTAPASVLQLAPGARASFRVGVTHGVTSTADCTTAYALQVIAPDDTQTMRVPIPGGAYECRTATVSPLQPGGSAFK